VCVCCDLDVKLPDLPEPRALQQDGVSSSEGDDDRVTIAYLKNDDEHVGVDDVQQ